MSKLRLYFLNVVIFFVSATICAVVFEVFAYAYWGPSISQWLTRPERDIQTDYDVTYAVTSNGTRIVCTPEDPHEAREIYFVGDSFTFGQGVDNLKDFVGLVSCRFPEFRIHNYGSIGRGLNYYRMVIEQKLTETARSLFVVLYENDVVRDSDLYMRDLKDWLYMHSYLASWLHHAKVILQNYFRKYLRNRSPNAKSTDLYNAPRAVFFSDPNSLRFVSSISDEGKAATKDRLKRLLSSAIEKNSYLRIYMTLIPEAATVSQHHRRFYKSVGATLLPPFGQPSPAYVLALEVCSENVACTFADIFKEVLASGENFYHPSDFHWNERGHQYLADKFSILISRDLVQ